MCSFWARRSLSGALATFLVPGKVSGPCLCVDGWMKEFAGNRWMAGNGRVRLEELSAQWVPQC